MLISRANAKDYGAFVLQVLLEDARVITQGTKWISARPLIHQHMIYTFTNMKKRNRNFRQMHLFTCSKLF